MNERSPAARERKRIRLLCGVAIVAILFSTLWPFNPFPKNDVTWLADANGIRFGHSALVLGEGPLQPAQENDSEKSISLEILLRPANIEQYGAILTFYSPDNPRKFVVSQWTDGLLVNRESVSAQGSVKERKFDVDHAFQAGKLTLLTITSGSHGTVVYRDTTKVQSFARWIVAPGELSGQMILGTPADGYQPWRGEISGLAIYSKQLTSADVERHYASWTTANPIGLSDLGGAIARYAFNERSGSQIQSAVQSAPTLEIPANFNVPHKSLLASAVKEFDPSRDYAVDVLQNVAGFVPLGMILCVYFRYTRSRAQAILYSVLAGAFLSFAVEFLQFYIPRRDSGTTDIITNTLGTVLGAAIVRPDWVRAILQAAHVLTSVNRPGPPQR